VTVHAVEVGVEPSSRRAHGQVNSLNGSRLVVLDGDGSRVK